MVRIFTGRQCPGFNGLPFMAVLIGMILLSQSSQASPDPAPLAAGAAVVAAHPLASQAGAQVLREGGTAADATLAAAMVLAVVEPQASGLGGGGFVLVRDPDGGIETIDFREMAPAGLDSAVFFNPADSLHLARFHGGTAVAIPGTPAGLDLLHARHGRLPLSRLLQPAISFARDGFPVSRTLSTLIAERADQFLSDSSFAGLFLKDGLPPMEGDTLANPALAALLEEIAAGGFNTFTERHAEEISRVVRQAGGWLTPAEIRDYRALVREPITSQWHDYTLAGPPPPASGALAVMQALEILEPLDLKAVSETQLIHLVSEALRKAQRDRVARVADPAFHRVPVDSLLASDYARATLAEIYPDAIHASWPVLGSTPVWNPMTHAGEAPDPRDKGNTTHISAWDAEGMVVSLTQSINYFFGAGLLADGVLLNNQIDDFSFEEGSPNYPRPGRRMRSSMAPMIVLKEGLPVLCLGTPGGLRIPSTMVELLVRHLALGQPLQEAIDAPRWYPAGATLVLEPRFSAETAAGLEAIGYRLYPMGPMDAFFGGAHGITTLPTSPLLTGAADPRRDGSAVIVAPR